MSKVKQQMEAICEVPMMNGTVVIPTPVEKGGYDNCLETMINYCLAVMSDDQTQFEDKVHELCKELQPIGFCCNTVQGMPCITVLLTDTEYGYNPVPDNMSDNVGDNYQFCYVINTKIPDFSEYGDCFFEKRADGNIYRVS